MEAEIEISLTTVISFFLSISSPPAFALIYPLPSHPFSFSSLFFSLFSFSLPLASFSLSLLPFHFYLYIYFYAKLTASHPLQFDISSRRLLSLLCVRRMCLNFQIGFAIISCRQMALGGFSFN